MSVIDPILGGAVEAFLPAERYTCTVGTGGVSGLDLVEFSADRTVIRSGAGSLVVAGVALYDRPAGDKVTVATTGIWQLTASGAIAVGARVIAAAAGDVAASGAAPDARTVVGYAVAAASGGFVLVKLTV